jgi:hypothetical protein
MWVIFDQLLKLIAESSIFQFAIEKYKDYNIHNYNFACGFVWA